MTSYQLLKIKAGYSKPRKRKNMKKKITNDYRTSELLEDKLQDHTDIAYKNSKIFPRTQHVNIVYEENDKIVAGLVGYNYLDYFHVGIMGR
ncbi:hypothetical protein [Staphylococcus pseudoxylosus]|nr:hypothetical protein [Staphylococcus pseudoxylosus]